MEVILKEMTDATQRLVETTGKKFTMPQHVSNPALMAE
jgi:hypothetical protein